MSDCSFSMHLAAMINGRAPVDTERGRTIHDHTENVGAVHESAVLTDNDSEKDLVRRGTVSSLHFVKIEPKQN